MNLKQNKNPQNKKRRGQEGREGATSCFPIVNEKTTWICPYNLRDYLNYRKTLV